MCHSVQTSLSTDSVFVRRQELRWDYFLVYDKHNVASQSNDAILTSIWGVTMNTQIDYTYTDVDLVWAMYSEQLFRPNMKSSKYTKTLCLLQ